MGLESQDHPAAYEDAETSRLAALDDILAIIRHELKTPLTVMRGYAATLSNAARSLDPDAITTAADAVERAALRMDALLSTFKDAQDFGAGSLDLHFRKVLASDLVHDVARDIQVAAPKHEIRVSVKDDAIIRIDEVRIRQVLTNLIVNSTKFAPLQSTIQVVLVRNEGNLEISVIDEGPGIAPERADELFQKFARLDSTKVGSGLGLYLSRAIARGHEGELELGTTEDGRGCCFKLTLPVHGPAPTTPA